MYRLSTIIFALWGSALMAQVYPDYKVPVPDKVVLNHACQTHQISRPYQDGATTAPSWSYFNSIVSDDQGNLYMKGVSYFAIDPNNAMLTSQLTFNSNLSNPQTIVRAEGHHNFICKYSPEGQLQWVTFFRQQPQKMIWNDTEQKLYLLIQPSEYEIHVNGNTILLDANIKFTKNVVLTINTLNGGVAAIYHHSFIQDFITAGGKNILIYNNADSYAYHFGVMYGFFRQNQVVKWQKELAGTNFMPKELHYNPYDNSLWYEFSNSLKYRRLLPAPGADSLIAENIDRNLYYELQPPYGVLQKPTKFHFTPDGNVLSEMKLHPPIALYHAERGLVKWNTSGNLIWKINVDVDKYIIDPDGNIWLTFEYVDYYKRVTVHPGNYEYYINTYGNIPEPKNFIWKINGTTGELMEAYRNGYGNNLYPNEHLLHITKDNKLIATPQMGAVAYYPDASGKFKPYFTTCSNGNMTSQFMWVGFDLSNLKSFKNSELEPIINTDQYTVPAKEMVTRFSIYPNPSSHKFSIQSAYSETFELYDFTGKMLDRFLVTENETFTYRHNLRRGVYLLKGKQSGEMMKILIQ